MQFQLKTTVEIERQLAGRLKLLRLQKKWKRSTLAKRSGVTESSLRRFEQSGKVSLSNFLKLLVALGRLNEMDELLRPLEIQSIDELVIRQDKTPQRGSI